MQQHAFATDTSTNQAIEIAIRILKGAVAAGASDIHLKANGVPHVRIRGELAPLDHPRVPAAVVAHTAMTLAEWAGVDASYLSLKQTDFSVQIPDTGRFRVHLYRQNRTPALAFRHIPMPVPDFATLRLPPVVKRIATADRGLVMVCGATGQGKSTTIAAMLEFINQSLPKHIVTIEDPIEYIFEDGFSSYAQREIGRDVDSMQQGLEGALREDPDVLFIGEIRTLEEFDIALNAAESGRLVVSTFHAADSTRAVNRMIHFYPAEQRESIGHRLADALAGVISQRLVAKRGGRERVLVTEILTRNPVVQDCIRDISRLRGLSAALDRGTHEYGSHSFDSQLLGMVRDGVITIETAKAVANNPNDLVRATKLTR